MKKFILLIGLFCLAAVPALGDVFISEVFYDHSSGDTDYEWVEITNTGLITFDLNGYILAWAVRTTCTASKF